MEVFELCVFDVFRSGLDVYDQMSTPAQGEAANTPLIASEGESIQDPGSVSVSDIMSPPSIGLRAGKPPPVKK